ncbi:hypothetical protein FOZ62_019152 [Perkinsus olseni]|uniref:Uncharacterized protein n=1 Tax=Perkinsus olseni TaxID=32597 RepID=A0A7J6SIR7_PEROL|nr:hypothetical protein FOZ62_019152 [Perkinsus olseni]
MRCSHVSYEIQRYPNELSGLHGSSLVQEYVHCSAADVRFGCASAFTLQYHGTHEHMYAELFPFVYRVLAPDLVALPAYEIQALSEGLHRLTAR